LFIGLTENKLLSLSVAHITETNKPKLVQQIDNIAHKQPLIWHHREAALIFAQKQKTSRTLYQSTNCDFKTIGKKFSENSKLM
jgi:hypothetical protein